MGLGVLEYVKLPNDTLLQESWIDIYDSLRYLTSSYMQPFWGDVA